jgi:hypothetical protein
MRRSAKVWVSRKLADLRGGHLSPEVFSACMGQARAFGLLSVWDEDIRVIPATRPTESSTLTALGNLTRGVDSAVATGTARASVRLFSAVAPAPALPLDTPRAPTAPTPEAAGQLALDQRIPATGKARAAPPQENATGAGGVRVPVVVAPSPLPEPHSGPQRPSGQERSAETAIGRRRPDLRKGTDTPAHQARSSLSNALLAGVWSRLSSDPGLTRAIARRRRQPA